MNPVDLSVDRINDKELMKLIEKGTVDIVILKSRNLATIENLDFLFLVDRITITELAAYWKMSRVTVYRKIIKDHGSKIVQARKINGNDKTITLNPKIVFDNIYDYEDFLKWRAEGREKRKTISIKKTMDITGLTRRQILTLIEKDKLVAIKKKNVPYEILNSSLSLFLIDDLLKTKEKMDKAVEYLNSNGNTVSMKLHIKDICI